VKSRRTHLARAHPPGEAPVDLSPKVQEGARRQKAAVASREDDAVSISDDELAAMAADAGCTVEELRTVFAQDPVTWAELKNAAVVAKRMRDGSERATDLKL